MKRTKHGFVSFVGIKAEQKISEFTLTAADIIAMNGAPITLIGAPRPNKVMVPIRAIVEFVAGNVAFTGGGAVSLVYHGGSTNLLTGTVAAATVQGAVNAQVSLGGPAAVALSAATGIDITNATAAFAAGNGTMIVTIWYTDYELN